MKRIILLLIMVIILLVGSTSYAMDRNSVIAVMDFGTRPGASEKEISLNQAEHITSEYVIDRLVNDNCFQVVEKDFVMKQIKQANIKTVGLIDPDTAKSIGEMLKVKYIFYGNITNVSLSDVGTSIGGTGLTKSTVKAHIVGRVMDVDSGNIIYMVKGDGKSASTFTKIPGVLAGTISFGTYKVTQDSVHNAIQKAAYAMVDELNKRIK